MRHATVLAAALLFAACSSMLGIPTEEERQQYLKTHDPAPRIAESIQEGCPAEGMSFEQLEAAIGRPLEINRSQFNGSVREQLIYKPKGGTYKQAFIYIENGTVTGWQNLSQVPRLSECY